MNEKRKTVIMTLPGADLANVEAYMNALGTLFDSMVTNLSGDISGIFTGEPDLILADVSAPGGLALLQRIRDDAQTRDVPIVCLTSRDSTEAEIEEYLTLAADCIGKPVAPSLLRKRVETILQVEAQKRELSSQTRELVDINDHLQGLVDAKTKSVVDAQDALLEAMTGMAESREPGSIGSIERTQAYLRILLNALTEKGTYEVAATWDLELILQSARLHDIGKIAVRDSILYKSDKLTDEEFEEIKAHAMFGEQIIDRIQENTSEQAFLAYAKVMSGAHHERWDGKGYPRGLAGDEIPLLGRIMAIADVYDALVSDRPFRKAVSHEDAVNVIKNGSGTQFDPALVEIFLEVADQFAEVPSSAKRAADGDAKRAADANR